MNQNETKKRLPLRCPACEAPLKVAKMVCDQRFMLEFVKASGSLKDMAKQMGVSYPTVRNYLDDLIEKLNNMEA